MTKIFLTGDRTLHPAVSLVFAASAISQLAIDAAQSEGSKGLQLLTGDNKGVEQGVRRFLDVLKVSYQVIPTGQNEDGTPALDTRHEVVNAVADQILMIHTEPLQSHIGASLLKVGCGSKVKIVTPTL